MHLILSVLSAIDWVLYRLIYPLVVLLSIAVATMVAFGVFSRELLDQPVFGLEELILLAAVWLYMLGAVLASRDRSHLSADFVQTFVKNPRIVHGFHLFAIAISLVMAAFFTTWSFDLLAWGVQRGQATTVFQIPLYLSQASLFAASLMFIVYLLRDLVTELLEFIEGNHDQHSQMAEDTKIEG
ncbi:TRAP transporter small permease [Oceanobacter mangrovi]|uniref:TRAP transporter small permease n=1 Tax=Oceanobacter mangrovi TaxID=2862510 RepID=UPI001C8E63AB|nr:TRAP transporter small permease [Oceanobacter mangrovi]